MFVLSDIHCMDSRMDERMSSFNYNVDKQPYFTRFFTEKLLVNRAVELMQRRSDTSERINTTLFLTEGWCSMVKSASENDGLLFHNIQYCIESDSVSPREINRIIRNAEFFLALRCSPDERLSERETPLLFMNWVLRSLASFFEKNSFDVMFSLETSYFPRKGVYFFSPSIKSQYLFLETLNYISNIPVENRESLSGRRICCIQEKIRQLLTTNESGTDDFFQKEATEKKRIMRSLIGEILISFKNCDLLIPKTSEIE